MNEKCPECDMQSFEPKPDTTLASCICGSEAVHTERAGEHVLMCPVCKYEVTSEHEQYARIKWNAKNGG